MSATVISTVQDPVKLAGEIRERYIARKAMEFENSAKEIIRGAGAIDQGQLVNSIFVEILEDGFIGGSAVSHAPYWEFSEPKNILCPHIQSQVNRYLPVG